MKSVLSDEKTRRDLKVVVDLLTVGFSYFHQKDIAWVWGVGYRGCGLHQSGSMEQSVGSMVKAVPTENPRELIAEW